MADEGMAHCVDALSCALLVAPPSPGAEIFTALVLCYARLARST